MEGKAASPICNSSFRAMPKPKRELKFEAVEGYWISTFPLTRSENQSPKKELEEPALEAFALPIFEKVFFFFDFRTLSLT